MSLKDGIGEGYTREDHQDLANQIFSSYSHVAEARSLASVIGEDELSPTDKKYLEFGKVLPKEYSCQGARGPSALRLWGSFLPSLPWWLPLPHIAFLLPSPHK